MFLCSLEEKADLELTAILLLQLPTSLVLHSGVAVVWRYQGLPDLPPGCKIFIPS